MLATHRTGVKEVRERIALMVKYQFATLRYCSNRAFGKKVSKLYFVVEVAFFL